jgi:hypothetical protein
MVRANNKSDCMKVIKVISHPYILITVFLMILISGEHFGGVYLLYLLLGLRIGAIHSILGLMGIVLLLISNHRFQSEDKLSVRGTMDIIGCFLLLLSIYLFFSNDREHYNYGTFSQLIPLISLILFLTVSLLFIVTNFWKVLNRKDMGNKIQLPNN